jgi:hypothetical protein
MPDRISSVSHLEVQRALNGFQFPACGNTSGREQIWVDVGLPFGGGRGERYADLVDEPEPNAFEASERTEILAEGTQSGYDVIVSEVFPVPVCRRFDREPARCDGDRRHAVAGEKPVAVTRHVRGRKVAQLQECFGGLDDGNYRSERLGEQGQQVSA